MQLNSPFKITALAFLAVCVNACSGGVIPDLSRLYGTSELINRSNETRVRDVQPPVILIHGAFGSRLNDRDTGEEYWPGSLWNILFSDYEDIRFSIDADSLMPMTSGLRAPLLIAYVLCVT